MNLEEALAKIEAYKLVLKTVKIGDPEFPEILIENPEVLISKLPTEFDIEWAKKEILKM